MRYDESHWQQLYNKLSGNLETELKSEPGSVPSHPGQAAVNQTIEAFEATSGYKLPDSYRAFAHVFGPGEIGGYFRIYIPGDQQCGYDLAEAHRRSHQMYEEDKKLYEQGELLTRLLFFAATIGGEEVGWDPRDVCDRAINEYRVYYVTRSGNARPVASSFPEFVNEICLKNNLHKFFGWENQEPEDWPPRTFLAY